MSYGKYNISEFFKIIIGKETSYKKDVMRNFIEACFKNKKIFQTIEGIRLSQLGKTDDCSTLACAATSSPVELALVPSALRAFSMDRAA